MKDWRDVDFRFTKGKYFDEVDLSPPDQSVITRGIVIWDPEALENNVLVTNSIISEPLLSKLRAKHPEGFIKDKEEMIVIVHACRETRFETLPVIFSATDEEGGLIQWGLHTSPPLTGFAPDISPEKAPWYVGADSVVIKATEWMPAFQRNMEIDAKIAADRDQKSLPVRFFPPVPTRPVGATCH